MGLICPCGTGSDQEERETPKTTSTGVSTQQHKAHCKEHRQKRQPSPSKKPLVVNGESTDSFRKCQKERQPDLERQPKAKENSSNSRNIKQNVPKKQRESQKNESQRRSRSSSSHHERMGQDVKKPDKHHKRGQSSEGRTGEKKTVLHNRREHHHKHYGGTDVKGKSDHVKVTKNLTHSDVPKGHGKHRDAEVTMVTKSEMKSSRNYHSSKPEERKPKERVLPSTDKEKPITNELEKKAPRKPKSSTPAYVIPMSAMLK